MYILNNTTWLFYITIILAILRLTGVIALHWLLVLLPFGIMVGIFLYFLLVDSNISKHK